MRRKRNAILSQHCSIKIPPPSSPDKRLEERICPERTAVLQQQCRRDEKSRPSRSNCDERIRLVLHAIDFLNNDLHIEITRIRRLHLHSISNQPLLEFILGRCIDHLFADLGDVRAPGLNRRIGTSKEIDFERSNFAGTKPKRRFYRKRCA